MRGANRLQLVMFWSGPNLFYTIFSASLSHVASYSSDGQLNVLWSDEKQFTHNPNLEFKMWRMSKFWNSAFTWLSPALMISVTGTSLTVIPRSLPTLMTSDLPPTVLTTLSCSFSGSIFRPVTNWVPITWRRKTRSFSGSSSEWYHIESTLFLVTL